MQERPYSRLETILVSAAKRLTKHRALVDLLEVSVAGGLSTPIRYCIYQGGTGAEALAPTRNHRYRGRRHARRSLDSRVPRASQDAPAQRRGQHHVRRRDGR